MFTDIEIQELEEKGCITSQFSGWKNNLFFYSNSEKMITLDNYIERKGKTINIITKEDISYEELLEKLE